MFCCMCVKCENFSLPLKLVLIHLSERMVVVRVSDTEDALHYNNIIVFKFSNEFCDACN